MKLVEGHADIDDVEAFVDQLTAIGEQHGAVVQSFDARYVAGRAHLEAAVDRANRAVARDDMIADDRAVEILLYAAGRRQIDQALELGVPDGGGPVVVVIDGGDEGAAAAASRELIEPEAVLGTARDEDKLCAFFGITDAERGASDASLEDLVIERVSLLVIDK